MKKLLFVFSIVLLASCTKSNNSGFVVSAQLDIVLKDADGLDLLNPAHSNLISENDIKLYYEVDGEKVKFHQPNLNNPNGLYVFEAEPFYRLRVYPNIEITEEFPISYIEWPDGSIDQIKCEVERTPGTEVISKVWVNEQLVWDSQDNTERMIELVK